MIEVTATRRVKSQRDIPGSVNALRGEYLEKIGAQGLKDYLKLIPGVSFIDSGTQDRGIPIIRGIATSTVYGNTPLGVGVFVDDLPFNDLFLPSSFVDANPFDMERVEVLKGPQSTLFGAGVLSGAIRYITRKPDLSVWNGKFQTSRSTNAHGDPSTFYGGAVNVPIYRDEAAVRLVALYRKDGGLYDFVPGDDAVTLERRNNVNTLEQPTGRVSAVWKPNERLGLQFTGFYQRSQTQENGYASTPDKFERDTQPVGSFADSKFGGSNLLVGYDFDGVRLESSSSYLTKYINSEGHNFTLGQETITGSDGMPGNDPGTEDQESTDDIRYIDSDVKAVVQELRFSSPEGSDSRWEWQGGLAYMNYQQYYRQRALLPGTQPVANSPNGTEPMTLPVPIPTPIGEVRGDETQFQQFDFDSDIGRELGVYGEVTRKFLEDERLELTAGGRLFQNTLGVFVQIRGIQSLLLLQRTGFGEYRKFSESGFNPKLSARYTFNRNVQAYALASKGFQFGGIQINPRLVGDEFTGDSTTAAFLPYKSSSLWNYELGLRTEFFERRLRFDTVVFLQNWKDMQITQLTYAPNPLSELPPLPPPGEGPQNARVGLLGAVQNIASARSQGVEVTLQITPAAGLSFTSNMGWTKAIITAPFDPTDDTPDGGVLPPGTRLPGSPRFQMSNILSLSRTFNVLGAWDTGASLTHNHIGRYFNALSSGVELAGYDQLDASITLARSDWRVSPDFTFTLRNITDVRGVSQGSGQAISRDRSFAIIAPRTALLALSLKF